MPSYRDYTIESTTYQGTTCYRVIDPEGYMLDGLAANKDTACKWIDADIHEHSKFK